MLGTRQGHEKIIVFEFIFTHCFFLHVNVLFFYSFKLVYDLTSVSLNIYITYDFHKNTEGGRINLLQINTTNPLIKLTTAIVNKSGRGFDKSFSAFRICTMGGDIRNNMRKTIKNTRIDHPNDE